MTHLQQAVVVQSSLPDLVVDRREFMLWTVLLQEGVDEPNLRGFQMTEWRACP